MTCVKNLSFPVRNNFNESVINSIQNISYAYNALNELKLNEKNNLEPYEIDI